MVSLAAHLALVVAWISTRESPELAESPTMEVQLARLPPKTVPEPAKTPLARISRPPPPLEIHQPPPPIEGPAPPPGPLISPEWRVRPEGPNGAGLPAAPFAGGRPRRAAREGERPDCKVMSWDRPIDCPPDAAEVAASKADPARDSRTAGFEGEGRYKRADKTYHEAPGGAGYPGIACAIFHRC
jgi:hypothetical protein